MESPQTLHDFVLNLLSNADARAAFQLDPQGALHDAGLPDVDAADVRDVIPLVVDYAPSRAVPTLDATLSQLSTSAAGGGTAGAIQQLQLVTQQLPPVSELSTMAGSVAGSLTGSLAAGGGLTGTIGLSGGLSPVTDVAHTLDAGAVADATNTVSGMVPDTIANTITNGVPGVSGVVPGTPDLGHPLGTLGGVVDGTTHGLTGDLSTVLGGGGLLDLSGSAGGPAGAVGASADASAHAGATTHPDSPLHDGVLGGLLDSTTSLLGAPDPHPLDVSHLF
jgi:hypothetical protein